MIEKALIIIIFCYAASFSLLGVQFILGDVFGYTLTSYQGNPIRSNLLLIVDIDTVDQRVSNVVNLNQTTIVDDPLTAAAQATLELFLLLTGTYVFNVLYLLGVPVIFIGGMVSIYGMLLIRTLIAYLRGI